MLRPDWAWFRTALSHRKLQISLLIRKIVVFRAQCPPHPPQKKITIGEYFDNYTAGVYGESVSIIMGWSDHSETCASSKIRRGGEGGGSRSLTLTGSRHTYTLHTHADGVMAELCLYLVLIFLEQIWLSKQISVSRTITHRTKWDKYCYTCWLLLPLINSFVYDF